MHTLKNIHFLSYRKISNTFLKILIYIIVAMFFLLILFSNILYHNYEKDGLALTYQYNKQFLHQLTYNLNYMNKMVKNFCVTQFVDPDNVHLMYSDRDDTFYIQRNINRFQKTLDSQSMYYSALLYNNKTQQFYSTRQGVINDDNQELKELIDNPNITSLTPIPRLLPKETHFEDIRVFTYVMYDHVGPNNRPDAALIVNVKTDWLFENIKKLNNNDINYIIVNKEGKVIADGGGELPIFQPLQREYWTEIKDDPLLENSFITELNHEKYVITTFPIDHTDWILISEQPHADVFNYMNIIRKETIIITIIFLIVALLIAIFIARNIYMPFGALVNQVKENLKDYFPSQNYKNDTEYLSKAIKLGHDKIKDFESYKKTTEDIINENFTKALLIENNFMSKEKYSENVDKFKELFGSSQVLVVILKIDKHKTIIEMDQDKRKQIKTIMFNVIEEKMKGFCRSQTVFMGNGEFVVMIDTSELKDKSLIHSLHDQLRSIQLKIYQLTSCTLSAFIGDKVQDSEKINAYYKDVQNMSRYRLIYGSSCIINNSIIKRHVKNKSMEYPKNSEEKILKHIKNEDLNNAQKEYKEFIVKICERQIDHFILALMRLSLAIQSTTHQININVDFSEFNSNLMHLDMLEEINQAFFNLFQQIINEQKVYHEQKHDVFIHSIQDYIQQEYSNKEISLKKVAAEFRMSSVYLGKLYRDATGQSVSDYINEVRLLKVTLLLETTQYNVRQIMNKVGYDNESNFYKLFKKAHGMMPKQYRMTHVLETQIVE